MSLKVIGSGLGRTGTLSLKLALDLLGFGPCHHMIELIDHPETAEPWRAAAEGNADWKTMYSGYAATVDYPGCLYWRKLVQIYPEAKIVHTTRDPEEWFESTQATIFSPTGIVAEPQGPLGAFFEATFRDLRPHLHDRTFMTDYFRRHTEAVLDSLPKDRVLVYSAREGWEPLCAFLAVPVPEAPFPRENSRQEFIQRHAQLAPLDEPLGGVKSA